MAAHYHTGRKLTSTQKILGWVYLPFYLVLNSWLLQIGAALLGWELDSYALNVLYFSVNLAFVLLVFHRFLLHGVQDAFRHFWLFVQTLILGFALYYCISLVVTLLLFPLLGGTTENNQAVGGLLDQNRLPMLFFIVLAGPITEEVLVRGVVFGTLHGKNRYLAYAASTLLFCLMHCWQYILLLSPLEFLANALVYLAPSVALGWAYEKSGTLFCPILLHMIINGLAAGIQLAG